jgi:hypothetical protein
MEVGMHRKLLSPRVQGHDRAGRRTQVRRIPRQLQQGISPRVEQQLGHDDVVQAPQDIQLVWNREDDVVMRAAE